MKNIIFFLPLLLIALLSSCTPDGISKEDTIGLSLKNITIDSDENIINITTTGEYWWINSVTLNQGGNEENFNFETSGIDVFADQYTLESNDYSIKKNSSTSLSISLNENKLTTDRVLNIGFFDRNYIDNVSITQQGK